MGLVQPPTRYPRSPICNRAMSKLFVHPRMAAGCKVDFSMQFVHRKTKQTCVGWCRGWNSIHFSRDRLLLANKSNGMGWLSFVAYLTLFEYAKVSKAIGPVAAQVERVVWETVLIISLWFCWNSECFFLKNNFQHLIDHQEKAHILMELGSKHRRNKYKSASEMYTITCSDSKACLELLECKQGSYSIYSAEVNRTYFGRALWTLGWCIPSILEINKDFRWCDGRLTSWPVNLWVFIRVMDTQGSCRCFSSRMTCPSNKGA